MKDKVTYDSIPLKDINFSIIEDYELLKEKLVLQLIPLKDNQELLSKVPHSIIEDFAVVYRAILDFNENCEVSMLITNSKLNSFNLSTDQFMADANEFCKKNHPLTICNIESVVFGLSEKEVEDCQLWVVSNDIGRYGASVISYPDTFETIGKKLGSGFYLIPSSIHEFLALPDKVEITANEINMMVKSVNLAEVDVKERLSDFSYHYDIEKKIFERATDYEERKRREKLDREANRLAGKICPICGNYYSDQPAISRIDNSTEICPDCGVEQGLIDYGADSEEIQQILRTIHDSFEKRKR